MLSKRHILTAALAAALSFGAVSAHAQNSAQNWNGQVVKEAQRSISPAEAGAIARKRNPGSEVRDIVRKGDTYTVILKKGQKRIKVKIDANTGRVKK